MSGLIIEESNQGIKIIDGSTRYTIYAELVWEWPFGEDKEKITDVKLNVIEEKLNG